MGRGNYANTMPRAGGLSAPNNGGEFRGFGGQRGGDSAVVAPKTKLADLPTLNQTVRFSFVTNRQWTHLNLRDSLAQRSLRLCSVVD